jgi:methylthioribose-1-phosphate isomerase
MDWILKHLAIVVFIAIGVANMLAKAKKAGAQQPARRTIDPDTTERTRRVQEEIRRKIAERTGRIPVSPPTVSPSPSAEPPARNIFQELARQMAEAKRMAEMQERAQAAAEDQLQQRMEDEQKSRELAEAQHLAEVQRTLQRQQGTVATAEADSGTTTTSVRDRLMADLREPGSLRRAWLLREILGEPVGLR